MVQEVKPGFSAINQDRLPPVYYRNKMRSLKVETPKTLLLFISTDDLALNSQSVLNSFYLLKTAMSTQGACRSIVFY